MAKHRSYSADFKRQIAQEYLGGAPLHGPSEAHDISRNLIRIWVDKHQAGVMDEDMVAADFQESPHFRPPALRAGSKIHRHRLDFGLVVPG